MTDWSFPPDLQAKYEQVLAQTRHLQQELGIEPRTIEQRYQDYLTRKAEEQRIKEELDKMRSLTGIRRPPIKWKV